MGDLVIARRMARGMDRAPAAFSTAPVAAPKPAAAPAPAWAGLPFTSPWLLAPMEGVTERCYRGLVLEANPLDCLGGATTEFVRVVDLALPAWKLREQLAGNSFGRPVGLQLMGSNVAALAESARRAAEAGAPLVDLNFGCPAKGALRGCSGSALLREPARVAAIVATVRRACDPLPVTAKIRAGFDHARDVEALARAVEDAGAAMLSVHCRTREEGYCEQVDWSRIARAVAAVRIPVCGNGGVRTHADLERMRRETGCDLVMVGHAALADPWIFSAHRVDRARAARFLLDYADALSTLGGASSGKVMARLKQLLRWWEAGDLCGQEQRADWLRVQAPEHLLQRLEALVDRAPVAVD